MGKAEELSNDLQEKVIQRYTLGKDYKKISKALKMLSASPRQDQLDQAKQQQQTNK